MDPKPGYKTTEFWLSLAAVLIGALMASGLLDVIPGNIDDTIVGVIATVLGALGYTVSRAYTKAASSKADAIKAATSNPPAPPQG